MADRRRNGLILLLVAGLLVASIAVIVSQKTRLGLDLKGGVELVYQGKPTPQQPTITQDAMQRAVDIMRERVDKLGVAEPEIQRSGRDQISVGLPDVDNQERAQRQVGTTAQLYFYDWEANVLGQDGKPDPGDLRVAQQTLTHYDAVKRAAERPAQVDRDNTTTDQFYLVNEKQRTVEAGPEESAEDLEDAIGRPPGPDEEVVEVKQGTVLIKAEKPENLPEGAKFDRWYVVNDDPEISGTDIKNPEQSFDNSPGGSGEPIVTFEFTKKGQAAFQEVTRRIAQRGQANQQVGQPAQSAFQHFAIVLDNEAVSIPYIDFNQNPDGIDGRTGAQISGGFNITGAQDLSNFLKIGALPIKLDLISSSQVSATLGKQALDQGLIAGAAGFVIVVLFLLAFYRLLGLIASVALGIYAAYFYALIELIPITLTLPGIAGLILTIGVAADANIVIFERVKEEVRAGRSVPVAISAGYRKGLSAIIDANVVTLMVAFILFVLATAGVKGFAFTLGVGVIVSLITAVLAVSAIMMSLSRTRAMARPSALGAGQEAKVRWHFDFIGSSKWFFSMSGVILIIGALAIAGKGLDFGIDFESGTRIKASLTQPADEDQVRDVLSDGGYGDAKIQRVQDPDLGANVFQISTATLAPDKVDEVRDALDERFGVPRAGFSNTSIGPTFGETVANSAVIAIIVSLLVISVYMTLRFDWKYAVPVLIALAHDLLITAGVYALADREVNTATVAALLTILGFSLYDTIIVFDRIRENVPRMPRAAFSQIYNRSMSEVLTRSLATSFCTLLPVLTLFAFGGETLRDFAFALIVGTASGTYSSVFIAGPVLTHWKEREPTYRRRLIRIKEENEGLVPAFADANAIIAVDDGAKRPARRLTAPDDPTQISPDEFQELVRDLGVDTAPAAPAPEDATRDLTPDEVVMRSEERRPKQRRPRNKRHGRPR